MRIAIVLVLALSAQAPDAPNLPVPAVAAPAKPLFGGGLSREEVQREVTSAMNAIKGCYEASLKKNPNLQGKVTLHWLISGTGDVTDVWIKGTTLNDAPAEECMRQTIKKLHFPSPKGGGVVNVTYPFSFIIESTGTGGSGGGCGSWYRSGTRRR